MGPRIGVMEIIVIVLAAALLLGITLVLFLRRRRPGAGFPVSPPAPAAPTEAEDPPRVGP